MGSELTECLRGLALSPSEKPSSTWSLRGLEEKGKGRSHHGRMPYVEEIVQRAVTLTMKS